MTDTGLIQSHVNKVRQIATKTATTGCEFTQEIDQIIAEAIKHISGVKGGDPTENLQAFRGLLNIYDQIEMSGVPRFQEAMEYASASFKRQIESR